MLSTKTVDIPLHDVMRMSRSRTGELKLILQDRGNKGSVMPWKISILYESSFLDVYDDFGNMEWYYGYSNAANQGLAARWQYMGRTSWPFVLREGDIVYAGHVGASRYKLHVMGICISGDHTGFLGFDDAYVEERDDDDDMHDHTEL